MDTNNRRKFMGMAIGASAIAGGVGALEASSLQTVNSSAYINLLDSPHLGSDGSGDASKALQTIIDALPVQESAWPDSPANTRAIFFPSPSQGYYCFPRTVTIPSDVNVKLFGEAFGGAKLKFDCPCTDTGDENCVGTNSINYLIHKNDGAGEGNTLEIENLAFLGGGILIQGRNRANNHISKCNFVDTKAPAVHFEAISPGTTTGTGRLGPVRTVVEHCDFYRCKGGVFHTSDTYLVGEVSNCYFKSMEGTSVLTDSVGVQIISNQFQGMIADSENDFPHVWLTAMQTSGASHNKILRNRFGGEVIQSDPSGNLYEVPRAALRIGSNKTTTSSAHFNILIIGNEFAGRIETNIDRENHAQHAIEYYQMPMGNILEHNYFAKSYSVSCIKQTWAATKGKQKLRNFVGANIIQGQPTGSSSLPLFEKDENDKEISNGWSIPFNEHNHVGGASNSILTMFDSSGKKWSLQVNTSGEIEVI